MKSRTASIKTHPPPSPIGRVLGDKVEIVETFIATELERLNYDALIDQVRIPAAVIADWYKRATGDRNIGTTGVSRFLWSI